MAPWLIYALGGGAGHFQRALSLARAAAAQQIRCTVLVNSRWADTLAQRARRSRTASPEISFQVLPPHATASDACAAMRRLLQASWSALVVDTFPRGLGGELASLLPHIRVPRVLVHRLICRQYVRRFELRDFVSRWFDLVLAPGEPGPLADLAQPTDPWLLYSHGQLSRLVAADHRRLRAVLPLDRPVLGVAASGRVAEAAEFARRAQRLRAQLRGRAAVRLLTLDPLPRAVGLWPLLRWLPRCSALVGAGGYNTVFEARAAGTPLRALAQPRLYDRQAARLQPQEQTSDERLLDAVESLLPTARQPAAPPAVPPYINGAEAAVAAILEHCSCSSPPSP